MAAPTGWRAWGSAPASASRWSRAADAFATDMLAAARARRALRAASRDARPPPAGDSGRGLGRAAATRDARGHGQHPATARAGVYWPGGIAVHASGDLHMVFGRWAHRLSPELEVLASHRLPVARPHNSFVVLDGGELVTKDCDAPGRTAPSTVSVLDPETLLPVAPALDAPRAVDRAARLDGESVIAVGTTLVFRLRLDRMPAGSTIDERWRPALRPGAGRSYGWDPVITDEHVLWMDNGRNNADRTMLGTGESPDPVRLWWARRDDERACARSRSAACRSGRSRTRPAGIPPAGS